MSALTDLIVQATDPVTALLIVGLFVYIRSSTNDIQDDVRVVRKRVSRVETAMIETDGGDGDGS